MLEIIRDERIHIKEAPWDLARVFFDRLTLVNPLWNEAVKHGRYKYLRDKKIAQHLSLYVQETKTDIALPNGVWEELCDYLETFVYPYKVIDHRQYRSVSQIPCNIRLRATQVPAVEAMLQHERGLLIAPPGAGKTVMGILLIMTL